MGFVLRLDTSCYTTSAALVDEKGELVGDYRELLQVPAGQAGLRQSDALFQHLQHLPRIWESFGQRHELRQLIGVAAIGRPDHGRPLVSERCPAGQVLGGASPGSILPNPVLAPTMLSD